MTDFSAGFTTETRSPVVVLSGRDTIGANTAGERLGGKGAALSRLIGTSFAVPPTGIVTTDVYRMLEADLRIAELVRRIRTGDPVGADEVDEAFLAAALPETVERAIAAMAGEVGDGQGVAVRSSATVEDLAESSFAGQYRSVLGVDDTDGAAVLDAVRGVLASLWHPAPCAYRVALDVDDGSIAMAAVVMRMVPTVRAGVVFTVDPGGRPDALRVEAVAGLGEGLVSGRLTPDAWVLPRTPPFDAPPEIAAAATLALSVEEASGAPQDVEWAFDGSCTWLVQARPITVSADDVDGDGFDTAVDDARLTTAGIGESLPGVLPPLRWALNALVVNEAFTRLVSDLGFSSSSNPTSPAFVRRVRGRAAMDLGRLGALADTLPGSSAAELEQQYFGTLRAVSTTRPGVRRTRRWAHARQDVRSLRIVRRASLDAEVVIAAVRGFDHGDPLELSGVSDAALWAYLGRLLDQSMRAAAAELAVSVGAASAYRRVELLLLPHLGDGQASGWAERVTRSSWAVDTASVASAAVFGGPTWDELGLRPPSGDELLRHRNADSGADLDELVAVLRSRPSWGAPGLRAAIRTRSLRQSSAEATTLLHRREAAKAALLRLGGEVRRVVLEMGRRLVAGGVLLAAGDIELLSSTELRTALVRREGASLRELAKRRRWLARYEAEAPLPSTFIGRPHAAPVDRPGGTRLVGWAASPGRVTAQAKVVEAPTASFAAGLVLVAAATDASWSPLFTRAAGIVVERGGPLSHAAILARELGVPAVLNVAGATEALAGETVTVDGDAGIVIVHRDDHRDAPESAPPSDRDHGVNGAPGAETTPTLLRAQKTSATSTEARS